MRLLDRLRDDHRLIADMLGALTTYAEQRGRGEAPAGDGARFILFFRAFAGRHHHAAEEDVLFPALAEHLEVPLGRGPLRALSAQHGFFASLLDVLAPQLAAGAPQAAVVARHYAHQLGAHIDAENSVLLPEAGARLVRAGVHELPVPATDDEATRAAADALLLLALYPAVVDPLALSGEGCVVCPSFGTDCDGIEREWWSDGEWEEFADHVG